MNFITIITRKKFIMFFKKSIKDGSKKDCINVKLNI